METKYVRVPFDIEMAKKITNGKVEGRVVKGNGDSTKNVSNAFNQLCEDLESLGNLDVSYWALHLRGNKNMLKSRAKQIVMKAKILQEAINCYTD